MALAPCRECGREVSTEAPSCPSCGVPRPTGAPVADPPPTPYAKVCPACSVVNEVRAQSCSGCGADLSHVASRHVASSPPSLPYSAPTAQHTSSGTVAKGVFGGLLGCAVAPFVFVFGAFVLLVMVGTCAG
jgi:hypothetical protein